MGKLIADLKVGYTCNNDCLHCVVTSQHKVAEKLRGNIDRPTAECLAEIEKSIANGCKFIVNTGGEPTIREDFFELLDCVKANGATIILQTNGRRLADWEFTEKLLTYPVICVVAVHSHRVEIHDKITQRTGSFEQTIRGIKYFKEYSNNIMGKCVISKYN